MTRFLLLIILLFTLSQNGFGQKMPSDYFEEGVKYVESKDYKNAITSFQYIVKYHPRNELFPRAYYNLGYLYFANDQYDSSIQIFKTILIGNFNEKENLGGGIMDDPYTNYKHRASELLSDVYSAKEMYDSALKYFSLSDTLYPYLHFCGNEYAENDVHKSLKYAEIYKKMNEPDKEIESLLPAVFITLANNSEVLKQLAALLKGKQNLQGDFDIALENIYPKQFKRNGEVYKNYYFKFLNVELLVPGGYEDDQQKFNKDNVIKKIKGTEFYKILASQ